MVTLELTEAQVEALGTLVQRELADLKTEIHHTDSWEYREQLWAKQGRLAECLLRLEEARTRSTL